MSAQSTSPQEQLAACKRCVWRLMQSLPSRELGVSTAALSPAAALVAADATWHVSHPFNQLDGPQAAADAFYSPMLAALPDLERRTDLFFAGQWVSPPAGQVGHSPPEVAGPGWWATAHGHYVGTLRSPWLGLPASGEPLFIRFGEFYRWDGETDRVTEVRVLLDLIDVARQLGRRVLPPSSGLEMLVPGPAPHDGLLLALSDPDQGRRSMDAVLAMIGGLFAFDGKNLHTMGMERFWHPNMMWYGPCGIGSTRGISGFQRHHQAPFLHAFPDRKGAGHRARIAEGSFVASTGWPSVKATHAGNYLGVPASQRAIGMRVADWWRRDGNWLTENWVLIDLPHLMLQMGVDLLDGLRQV